MLFRYILLVMLALAPSALAQQRTVVETAKEKAAREADLAKVSADLAAAEALRGKLDAEIEALDADVGAINRALVEATARAQDLEGDVAATETRLEDLGVEEQAILGPPCPSTFCDDRGLGGVAARWSEPAPRPCW